MGGSTVGFAAGLACIFVALATLFVAIGWGTRDRAQVARSLSVIGGVGSSSAGRPAPSGERLITTWMPRMARLGRALSPAGYLAGMRRRLEKAGSPPGWDAERILAGKAVLGIAGAALGIALPALLGKGFVSLVAGIMLGLIGFFVPDFVLLQRRENRQVAIRRSLADAMDMLTISVEAGLSFDSALAQVSQKTKGPLADELARTLREMQIASSRMEALRALSDRVDVPDLRAFVTAMVQADSFGIPIANVLRVQAKELRVRRRQNAEERAQKVPIKMVFPLVLCILPALLIIIVGPAVIQIAHLIHGHGFL